MKGYYVPYGYMGFIQGKWLLFPTETEYVEAYTEREVNNEQI